MAVGLFIARPQKCSFAVALLRLALVLAVANRRLSRFLRASNKPGSHKTLQFLSVLTNADTASTCMMAGLLRDETCDSVTLSRHLSSNLRHPSEASLDQPFSKHIKQGQPVAREFPSLGTFSLAIINTFVSQN